MICLNCGIAAVEHCGDIVLNNRTIGDFTVTDITYQECSKCGEQFFSPETLDAIESKEKEIKECRLGQYPITDFIGAVAAAKILGVTRQALHRNRRIRRGFIYSVVHEGKIEYLKKSVELYKKEGDGRFELVPQSTMEQAEYVKNSETEAAEGLFVESETVQFEKQRLWQPGNKTSNDFNYVFSPNYQ
ncbi:YgiT-type zinc finger protein [bacterium]|nr:YgiT-type zinc finger protein [bacterium]